MRDLATNSQPQTPTPRLDRLRSARARYRVRRTRTDEKHHPLGTQHCPSSDRRIHALGQRMRGAISGIKAHRLAISSSRKAGRQASLRFRGDRSDIRIFSGVGRAAHSARAVQERSPRGIGTGNARTIEVPRDIHVTPRMYQKLAAKIAGKPEERILSYLMLRSLKQARYSEENLGHFALAATSYTHFTSPIRRYPDLIVHRILK